VQTVDDTSAPELCAVLSALEANGRPPVVLNTSLNGIGEPMCVSALDAIEFLVASPIDALVLEDVVIRRKG
jgi:carbamoyltransferase